MLRSELKSLLSRFMLPAMVAVLPDALGYAWLRFWARFPQLGDGNSEASWAIALRILGDGAGQRAAFIARVRLYELLDWADVYWANSRSIKWLSRNVVFEGDPIPSGPAMGITLHYGAGLWSLHAFSRHYTPVGWVHAPIDPVVPRGQKVTAWLSRWRLRTVRRIPGVLALSTPGAHDKMQACVDKGGGLVGLIDAPFQGGRRCSRTTVLGRPFNLPNGLLRFALAQNMPVYLYTMTLNPAADGRIFRGRLLDCSAGLETMMQELGKWMTDELLHDPAAWHLWRFSDHFFVQDAST